MSNNAEQYTVPMNDIPEKARLIAVAWVDGYKPYSSIYPEIAQKHKLASDIVNYAREYSSELIKENERLRGTIGVECVKQLLEARQENAKLKKFKEYVHSRLDKMGIPSDPEPEKNAEHGCRIEGRLNYIESKFQPNKDENNL